MWLKSLCQRVVNRGTTVLTAYPARTSLPGIEPGIICFFFINLFLGHPEHHSVALGPSANATILVGNIYPYENLCRCLFCRWYYDMYCCRQSLLNHIGSY